MNASAKGEGPTISTCLLRPFYKLLANYQLGGRGVVEQAHTYGAEARIPLERAHKLLQAAIMLTGDPDLGLKAGRMSDFEDAGALAYAAGSAPTVRDAIQVGSRYMKLLNDGMDFRMLIEGTRVAVRLESKGSLPRASADFQASALRAHHRRTHANEIPGLEWWFMHERPVSIDEYERTFGETTLRFAMPYFGFCFDARHLDMPLATADARQHDLLVAQMDAALAGLPRTFSVADRVRTLIVRQLPTGGLTSDSAAKALGLSRRTLTRRLAEENSSFSELLDDTRRRLAIHYLTETDRTVSSIAFLLGFSEVPTFYRAFRRWTNDTPLQYRQAHQPSRGEEPQT